LSTNRQQQSSPFLPIYHERIAAASSLTILLYKEKELMVRYYNKYWYMAASNNLPSNAMINRPSHYERRGF
jgi:hypothetical protein